MRPLFALILSIALAACAAPSPNGADAAADAPAADLRDASGATPTAHAPRPQPAPPAEAPAGASPGRKPMRTGGPLPADPIAPAPATTPVALDTTCRVDADCTVKNVGNCCGYAPACVNVDSPTDPEGVRAECEKRGMVSICGFQEIAACRCVQGRCEAAAAAVAQ